MLANDTICTVSALAAWVCGMGAIICNGAATTKQLEEASRERQMMENRMLEEASRERKMMENRMTMRLMRMEIGNVRMEIGIVALQIMIWDSKEGTDTTKPAIEALKARKGELEAELEVLEANMHQQASR